ncbi:MAG: hypothetical protein AAGB13_01705 [Cyanobacteria bacterium P01_F01_bin.33]
MTFSPKFAPPELSLRSIRSSGTNKLRVISTSENSPGVFPVPLVFELGEHLSQFDDVNRVRVVARSASDLHWLEFEVETESPMDFSDSLWDAMQDHVIDLEWRLRDETQEDWYFHLSRMKQFPEIEARSKIVWKSFQTSAHQIQSSTPTTFVIKQAS